MQWARYVCSVKPKSTEMKNLLKIMSLLLLMTTTMFIQSCDEGDDIKPAPTVGLDATSGSNIPGEPVTINATVNAPNGGQALIVYVNGAEEEAFDMAGAKDFEQAFEYTVPTDAAIGSKIIISFQAIDNDNYPSAVANYTLTVGDPVVVLEGELTTQTLDAANPYLLKGQVFINSGVTLTIPAGTTIKGDKASKAVLVVRPGGQLVANGTVDNPVVFTSAQSEGERDRGDWGGIVMLGNAFVNQTNLPAIEGISPAQTFGQNTDPATNANHNGGTLNYVRIEYAGIELTPNNETNSLTMGGVGNGTTIDYVQVSYGGDDGFEWFGGTVNAKHLISLSTWDDDFDTDFGYQGKVQFALAVRNPFFADQSGSNAFESDNQASDTDNSEPSANRAVGYTQPVFSNVTVLGPRDFNAGINNATRTISANYQNTLHLRRRTGISIFNSFFSGFPTGLKLDDAGTLANLNSGLMKLAYNVMAVPTNTELGATTSATGAVFVTNTGTGDATFLRDYWTNNNNTFIKTAVGALWSPTPGTPTGSTDPYPALGLDKAMFWGGQNSSNFSSNPTFSVTTGTLSSGANFADPKLANFFEAVSYRGAFGGTDWTDGWAEFQPLNAQY
jgi:hypothetical protein